MKTLMLTLCVLLATMAWASQEGKENTAAALLILTDWAQTRAMTHMPIYGKEIAPGVTMYDGSENWREMNPILGHHPNEGRVNTYFAASALAYVLVQKYAPEKWATWHRRATIGLEITCVSMNVSLGIKF